jgi:hypothetical protein
MPAAHEVVESGAIDADANRSRGSMQNLPVNKRQATAMPELWSHWRMALVILSGLCLSESRWVSLSKVHCTFALLPESFAMEPFAANALELKAIPSTLKKGCDGHSA